MNKKLIYIASKMTGLQNYGYDNFYKVEKELQENGYCVINPARNYGGDQSLDYETYIRMNISQLLIADAIYLFGNWQNSKGACFERQIAQMLKLEIYFEGAL